MPRVVRCGLIQAASPITDPAVPIAEVRDASIAAHIPFIEEAGRRGVQILGLQEVFNGPYFCPSQDAHWYDLDEPVPGPTTEAMAAYARQYQMAMVVPVYEREQAGVYYNTAAVLDADGAYLGKYRKNHIPHTSGFWEKYFFKPGNLGYPVFKTRYATIGVYICYDRHFPEGARLLGLNGAEIVFNPSATVAGLSQYLWKLEQPAHAVANGYFMACSNRVGTEAPVQPQMHANDNVRAPDLAVTCAPPSSAKTFPEPVLIIEVMSPSNQKETWDSIYAMATIPTLIEIVVVDSENVRVEVFHRVGIARWPDKGVVFEAGDTVRLESISAELPVSEIYAGTHLA